ncbi:YrhB family protein [Parachryseolinea silvisoli]|uniref:YrhB family protein n=1 Tax=Parachryseolinea silvisoli TaxID=2873601 RepID=UPI0022659138|nr:YrhB family protein [Parachryseolinea silvisoli]MCD9016034.1 YrhB family protein [Parachryseolinea silvisoli]
MADYFQEARNYAIKQFGNEYAVDQRSIVDEEDFFSFVCHTKAFLETGDFSKMTVGQGYTFIVKRDNRIIPFGSGLSFEQARATLEKWLAAEIRIKKYKREFDPAKRYDIQITRINKRWVIIDKLLKFEIAYTIPEIVGDSIFRIPKKYNSKILEERLTGLPVTFCDIKDRLSLIDELLVADACEFDLVEHREKNFAKYTVKATEEDLKPIW